MHFVIKPMVDTPNDSPDAERFDTAAALCARGDDLSGRPGITAYCLKQAHTNGRRGRRASSYVAAARGAEAHGWQRRGFSVEVVD